MGSSLVRVLQAQGLSRREIRRRQKAARRIISRFVARRFPGTSRHFRRQATDELIGRFDDDLLEYLSVEGES